MTRVIDAHQHYWQTALQDQPWRGPEHQALETDFGPADLAPVLQQCGIDGTVLIQSVDEPAENDRLARYAQEPTVAGVVGWLPIADPAAARAELDRILATDAPTMINPTKINPTKINSTKNASAKIDKLVGVRCLVADDPLDWLTGVEAGELFAVLADHGLAWDVVPITRQQIDAVLRLTRAVPQLRIVVDHLGRPPLETAGWQPWADQIAELAAADNVAVKLSIGINALTSWPAWDCEAVRRYARHVLDTFGPDRVMLASNWPVVLLRADYRQAWKDLSGLLDDRDPAERAAVLGGTAERWYRLPRADPATPDPPTTQEVGTAPY